MNEALRKILPRSRFLDPAELSLPEDRDISRFDIGRPEAWLRPRSTAEVQSIVKLARRRGVRVVPVGRRSAYWRPLDLSSAIAVDTSGLTEIAPLDVESGSVCCGAGVSVLQLDDELARHGFTLPLYPDAFGDTSIGSLVATACASGLGMGNTDIDGLLLGLRVVLGTGEELVTGTARVLGAPPFIRIGLPDPTALFVGSQGSLGIVTEVALRLWRRCFRAQISLAAPAGPEGLRATLRLAEELRIDGLYETLRAARTVRSNYEEPVSLDIVLRSPVSDEELTGRIAWVERAITRHFPGSELQVVCESPNDPRLQRFRDPPDGHLQMYRAGHYAGLDAILPYGSAIVEALGVADEILREAAALAHIELRQTIYAAPGYVNLGLHLKFKAADEKPVSGVHQLLSRGVERLVRLPITPYRWGGLWSESLAAKLDPSYRDLLRDIERICDPDGVFTRRTALGADVDL